MSFTGTPYWIEVCRLAAAPGHKPFTLGEFFVVLLDRLNEDGVELGDYISGLMRELRAQPKLIDYSHSLFLEELGALIARFKEKLERTHVSYFRHEGSLNPAFLGYQVYCLHLMERVHDRIRLGLATARPFEELESIPSAMFSTLLDWDGGYAELDNYYWHRELNDIMGVPDKDEEW